MAVLRKLILEDGSEYLGEGFGAKRDTVSEIVFNTSMAGYQEILSDPSYTDQAIVMSYPLMGNYGIAEEDFLSAEIEVVPAGKARDYGLDRSMVIGYGQDDRVCAFTSFKALLEAGTSGRTGVCLLTDKEEIGSVGATGAQSSSM